MPKVICTKCQKTMKATEKGVVVVEMFRSPPSPYKLWQADLYTCTVCGCQVITAFAQRPFAEHWQENFAAILAEIENVIEWYE